MTSPAATPPAGTADLRALIEKARDNAKHEAAYRIETPHGTVRYEPGYPKETLYGQLAEALATLHADKDRLARDLAAAREESSRWEAAARLLLPFVDAAAGEELEIARTEHGPRLESMAICCATAAALGITVDSAEYEALAALTSGEHSHAHHA